MNGYPDLAKEYMEKGISVLQKLSGIIKEYLSDDCLNYAKVQETLGTIYLMTANLSQAKTHFKRAFKIYEKTWADEPKMIEAKYQEIQELYPQVGFFLGQQISSFLTKQA
jgi:tetratricopeptide (TPR) repeat protein